jgi:hypothetical protein
VITEGEKIYVTDGPSEKKGYQTNYDGFVKDVPL